MNRKKKSLTMDGGDNKMSYKVQKIRTSNRYYSY